MDEAVERDQVGRAVGIVGLAGIALIHLIDSVSKFSETRYIFGLYVALMVITLAAAAVLLRWDSRAAWTLATSAAAATLLAYLLSRTTGLPQASQDIGNWSDQLGLASVFVESCVVALGAYKLVTTRPVRPALAGTQRPYEADVTGTAPATVERAAPGQR